MITIRLIDVEKEASALHPLREPAEAEAATHVRWDPTR